MTDTKLRSIQGGRKQSQARDFLQAMCSGDHEGAAVIVENILNARARRLSQIHVVGEGGADSLSTVGNVAVLADQP